MPKRIKEIFAYNELFSHFRIRGINPNKNRKTNIFRSKPNTSTKKRQKYLRTFNYNARMRQNDHEHLVIILRFIFIFLGIFLSKMGHF